MRLIRKIKRLIFFIIVVCLFLLVINILPPTKAVKINGFLNNNANVPMLAAHRGGSLSNPENTLMAYRKAVSEYHIDIVESDLWLTKDERLVFSHDGTIDRMSDIKLFDDSKDKHYICDYTLDELKEYNFGYGFTDKNGNTPYKDLVSVNQENRRDVLREYGLQIIEVSELFDEFYELKPDLKFIVEIKDGGERGFKAAEILDNVLSDIYPHYKANVVIGTFHDEISKCLKENHPTLLRGASTGDARNFILTQLFRVNYFNKADFACLQIPTSYNLKGIEFKLDKKTIIDRAHRRNIAVQYWTINDKETMLLLAQLGCDCIMTDDPELFNEVFNR